MTLVVEIAKSDMSQ